MITKHDLQEAIAECQGERNPNSNTCIKLAAFYTILDHLDDGASNAPECPVMSFAGSSALLDSNTEFADVVNSTDQYKVMRVIDELMSTLDVINPRLYSSVMYKLHN